MKTLDELELLTVDQLKGIAAGLAVDVKSNIKKAELVQLVYDIQQPDHVEEDTTGEEKTLNDNPDLTEEEMREEIEKTFDGELEAIDESDDKGAVIYVVTDVVGEEVARGTLLTLWNLTQEGEGDGLDEVPLSEDTPEPAPTPVEASDDLKKALEALRARGLQYTIETNCVVLQHGAKKTTTTLDQPTPRIIRVAEALCGA